MSRPNRAPYMENVGSRDSPRSLPSTPLLLVMIQPYTLAFWINKPYIGWTMS